MSVPTRTSTKTPRSKRIPVPPAASQFSRNIVKRPVKALAIAFVVNIALAALGSFSFGMKLIYGGVIVEGDGRANSLSVYRAILADRISISTIGKDVVAWNKDMSATEYVIFLQRWCVDGRWAVNHLQEVRPNTASLYYKFVGWPLRWLCLDESVVPSIEGVVGGMRLPILRLAIFPGRLAFDLLCACLLLLIIRALKLIVANRKGLKHLCQNCSYDISGVSKCPECGRIV